MLAIIPAIVPRTASAQQTSVADTVTGRVVSQDSTPIPRAQVRLKGDDGRVRNTTTDSAGRYRVTMPNGAGMYELRARAFGYSPFAAIVQRASGATHIERDLILRPHPYTIPTVKVVGRSSNPIGRVTPAEQSSRWDAFMTQDRPLEPGSLTDVAAIQPGVVRSGAGLSIAGQGPDQNKTTVDGASYSGANLPAEGVASIGVVTSSYDVARGQFSGGQIIASTISGTNLWGGAFHVRVDDPALTYGSLPGGLSRDTRNISLSTGAGGPLIHDKFFTYAALDLGHSRSPVSSLDGLDATSLTRLGMSPDSVRRLLDIVQQIGAYSPPQAATTESGSDYGSMLARFDYALSDGQSLTARIDWRGSNVDGLGASPFSLQQGDGNLRSRDAGFLLQLASGWGLWANELRAYRSGGSTRMDPGLSFPHAEAQLSSTPSADGIGSNASIAFGGIPFELGGEHSLTELSDKLVRETSSRVHRIDAGFVLQQERATAPANGNRFGSFVFNSLGDLETGQPALFSRNVGPPPHRASRQYAAAYLGDIWHPHAAFQLIYGLRVAGSHYGARPAPSAAVTSIAPDASTRIPSELLVTPRVGFSYSPEKSMWQIDGGIGGFDGVTNMASLASLQDNTGTRGSNLVCVGAEAPRPAWGDYRIDAATIPSTCAGGASPFSSDVSSATLFNRHFGAPRTWRASLNFDRPLIGQWVGYIDAMVVHGTHLPTAVDRNFVPDVGITLADEQNRPVYAGADAIDPATGGIAPGAARENVALGTVREVGSRGQSWTEQITAGGYGHVGRASLMFDYTFTHSRVRASAISALGGMEGTTDGSPLGLKWQAGGYTPQHTFLGMLNYQLLGRISLAAIGRLSSGLPFTPLVRQDINGDGFSNDRAFVFDPANAQDPAVAQAMERLRFTAPASVRECLQQQAGRIAQPGSCHTGWVPSLDLRANIVLGKLAARRVTVSLFASNVTAGVDYLLHGPDKLHGWGQYPSPDATLLDVRGFDPGKRAYKYAVNPRFGQPQGGGLSRLPFHVTLQARITVGADPRFQPLMAAILANSGASNASARENVARQIRNVPAIVLQLIKSDSSAPTIVLAQQAQLRQLADSLAPEMSIATDSLTAVLISHGPMTAARKAREQKWTERARALVELAVRRTREIISPEQWKELPAWLIKPADPHQLRTLRMRETGILTMP